MRYHTPPYVGGLVDQPIKLMNDIRTAVNAYNIITAYKDAGSHMSMDAFSKWQASHRETMKYMEYVWELQAGADLSEE